MPWTKARDSRRRIDETAKGRNGRPIDLASGMAASMPRRRPSPPRPAPMSWSPALPRLPGGPPAYAGNIRRLRDAAVAPP